MRAIFVTFLAAYGGENRGTHSNGVRTGGAWAPERLVRGDQGRYGDAKRAHRFPGDEPIARAARGELAPLPNHDAGRLTVAARHQGDDRCGRLQGQQLQLLRDGSLYLPERIGPFESANQGLYGTN